MCSFLEINQSPSPAETMKNNGVGESNVHVRGVRRTHCGDSLWSPLLLYSLMAAGINESLKLQTATRLLQTLQTATIVSYYSNYRQLLQQLQTATQLLQQLQTVTIATTQLLQQLQTATRLLQTLQTVTIVSYYSNYR